MKHISAKIILAAVIFAVIILTFFTLILRTIAVREAQHVIPTAVITIIPPTNTYLSGEIQTTPSATPTLEIENPKGIAINAYIKISQTGGSGLRIRTQPGTSSAVLFLAMDEEVFRIIGGPQEKDDLIWWQVQAPYDSTRSGWAAADYLEKIETE